MIKEFENRNLLYKFDQCNKYSFSSLKNSTFYFSSVSNFNDPSEAMFSMQSMSHNKDGVDYFYKNIFPFTALKKIKPENRNEIIKQRREHIASDYFLMEDVKNSLDSFIEDFFGVVCFSKTYIEPLMWAHYTNSGKGICQIYDPTNLFQVNSDGYPRLETINYEEKLPVIPVSVKKDQFGYNIRPLITTKRKNWAYEQEVRAYINMSKITSSIDLSRELINRENGRLRNIKYNHKALKGIIFGHQCTTRNINKVKKELSENIDINIKAILFYKAIRNSSTGNYYYKKIE